MKVALSNGMGYFYQWDTGQKIHIPIEVSALHFMVSRDQAMVIAVSDGWAKVPDSLLQKAEGFFVWAYKTDHTVDSAFVRVKPRSKPDSYISTPDEASNWETIIDAAVTDALTEAKESGEFKGDTGATGATPDITVTASTDDTSGTPAVTVTKSGTAASPSFNLAFTGLKGEQGDKGESTNNIAPLTVPEANKPTAEGENAVAIGKDAEAEWSESVALGCGSKTYAACEVSVGSATYRRRITNVGTPEYEYDTATKGYVDEAVAGCASTSYVDTAITEAKSYTDTAIAETKSYVDSAITAALTVDSEGAAS